MMRRFVLSGFCALLALLCVLAFSAAETLPCFRETEAEYPNEPFFAPESYSEICLTTVHIGFAFGRNPPENSGRFVLFPPPEDLHAYYLTIDQAFFQDDMPSQRRTKAIYHLYSGMSVSSFLENADKGSVVLRDEAAGTAAYVRDNNEAYGFISVPELGEGYGVQIYIQTGQETTEEIMEEAVTAEVNRVAANLRVEDISPWWSFRKYGGFEMYYAGAESYLLHFEFPMVTGLSGSDETGYAIGTVGGNKVYGAFRVAQEKYVSFEIGMQDRVPSSLDTATTSTVADTTLSGGATWRVSDVYTRSSCVFGRVIPAPSFSNPPASEKTYWIYFKINAIGFELDEATAQMIVESVSRSFFIVNGNERFIPSEAQQAAPVEAEDEPAETPAEEPKPTAAETGTVTETGWTCEACGRAGNAGNFCPNCGAAKPVSAGWTCEACGQAGNTGNFCPNCGAAKPQ